MRVLLLAPVLVLGCSRAAEPVAPVEGPRTDGVEGHGGIAITGPRNPAQGGTLDGRHQEWSDPAMAKERTVAREVYLRGYQLRDSNPRAAAALFRQVVAMEPPGSETRAKALHRLAELGEPLAK